MRLYHFYNKLRQLERRTDIKLEDLSECSGIDKIAMLAKLGLLEKIKELQSVGSVNRVAEILSFVTGEKTETIQPYLNAYYTDAIGNKNPMNSKNRIDEIELRLIQKGFIIPHTD
jgi:hypothetical protein